ncbi:MAG: hypothetical protein H6Q14_800 [Bacteroidetes bacterium]|jgi:hypothetical protein|nr:hypothetical protein [Bacteroidota bacterium]
MLIRGFRKYTMNPALGFLPIGVFIFLNANSVNLIIAILASTLLSLLLDSIFRFVLKTTVFWLMSIVSMVPLVLTCIFALLAPVQEINIHNYMIICEIWMVLTLFVIRGGKKHIANRYFKRIDIREKTLLQEIFSTMGISERLFTLHLFVVLAYSFLIHSYGSDGWDFAIYVFAPLTIIVILVCYESFMLRSLSTRFFKEEWLPVVNEQGRVIGKVAKSVSFRMKNRFLHPVIRIALVCNHSIYLQKRPEDSTFEPGCLDHPFEKYMLFKHDLNLAARNSIAKQLGGEALPYTFQLKYIYENSETKRLVLFYVSLINSADEIKNISMLKGKFWTVKQIEDEIHSTIFGECFLREYEYLKSTMLNPAIKEII